VTTLTDARQTVVARYRYDPFGNLLGLSGPMAEANLYRFSSKEWHANSGLYYYGYRFYEPALQRWLNRDPLGEAGGLNMYRFLGNTPLGIVDAFGLEDVTLGRLRDSEEECEGAYLQDNFKERFSDLTQNIRSTAHCIAEATPGGNAWVAFTGQSVGDEKVSNCQRGAAIAAMATGPAAKLFSKSKGLPCWLRKLFGFGDDAAKSAGSALEQALARAKPVGDRLEAVLDDGLKVIFRRDVGPKAHPLPGYPKPTDHWNIEVHKPIPGRPGRFEPVQDTHIVLDPSGKPIDIIHTK